MARIMMSKYFERIEYKDFSDDGNRFRMYVLHTPNGDIEISYLKSFGDVYLSPRGYSLKGELTYDELVASCPTYSSLDMYNGVDETTVDLEKLVDVMNKFTAEVTEAKKDIKPVNISLVDEYVRKYNTKLTEIKTKVKEKITLDFIINIKSSYERNAILDEYKRLVDTEALTTQSLMNMHGRAYLVDLTKCNPSIALGYYLDKYVLKQA